MEYIYRYASPLGGITVASDGEALIGLWFDGQKYYADTLGDCYEEKNLPIFGETAQWLDIYFGGEDPGFAPPISLRVTPFRRRVAAIMLAILYGKTMTYGEIAKKIAAERNIPRMAADFDCGLGHAAGRDSAFVFVPALEFCGDLASLGWPYLCLHHHIRHRGGFRLLLGQHPVHSACGSQYPRFAGAVVGDCLFPAVPECQLRRYGFIGYGFNYRHGIPAGQARQ